MDIVDNKTRSRIMSRIRSADTGLELRIRRYLHHIGFRFRLHVRNLPGRPDITLRKHRLVIFVHGCFWHRHRGCRLTTNPATNSEAWHAKFRDNVHRDQRNVEKLREAGWRVLIIWECGLRGIKDPDLTWITEWIRGSDMYAEWPDLTEELAGKSPSEAPHSD